MITVFKGARGNIVFSTEDWVLMEDTLTAEHGNVDNTVTVRDLVRDIMLCTDCHYSEFVGVGGDALGNSVEEVVLVLSGIFDGSDSAFTDGIKLINRKGIKDVK